VKACKGKPQKTKKRGIFFQGSSGLDADTWRGRRQPKLLINAATGKNFFGGAWEFWWVFLNWEGGAASGTAWENGLWQPLVIGLEGRTGGAKKPVSYRTKGI